MIGAVLAGGRSARMGRDKAALRMREAHGKSGDSDGAGGTSARGAHPPTSSDDAHPSTSPRVANSPTTSRDPAIAINEPELTWLERAILLLAQRFAEPWVVGRKIARGDPEVRNLSAFPESFPELRSREDLRPGAGPLAGLETALELAAGEAALVIPCDLPRLDPRALDLLLAARGSAPALAFRLASGQLEPAVVLAEPETLPDLRRYLDEGQRAAHRFLDLVHTRWLELPRDLEGGFLNVNTPGDLARLVRRPEME